VLHTLDVIYILDFFRGKDKFLNKAKMAQSSYQHAIELAPGHSVIWTEYGNFVYMVHSFCSRLLKQETDTLSMERFEILETRKEEMLKIADQCFESANRICQTIEEPSIQHDERWLYQYMLGKVAEKKNQDPPVFLEHYTKVNYYIPYILFLIYIIYYIYIFICNI